MGYNNNIMRDFIYWYKWFVVGFVILCYYLFTPLLSFVWILIILGIILVLLQEFYKPFKITTLEKDARLVRDEVYIYIARVFSEKKLLTDKRKNELNIYKERITKMDYMYTVLKEKYLHSGNMN